MPAMGIKSVGTSWRSLDHSQNTFQEVKKSRLTNQGLEFVDKKNQLKVMKKLSTKMKKKYCVTVLSTDPKEPITCRETYLFKIIKMRTL